ncbi:toxin-antitoxin system (plasmid) [Mycobacterium paragordonae]|nr:MULTISPECIES: ribbon-helix-helix protein, CopG family [Mycobacterium]AYE99695.1 toxin-antitoxin system [Mycobacterium paragordonae]
MAQHHKGARVYMAARLPEDVYAAVKTKAADTGLSMSQLVADLLSEAIGRPDLVRNLGKHDEGVLPLAM